MSLVLQYEHASRHPVHIGIIAIVLFFLFLGRSSFTGFAFVSLSSFCFMCSFILSMWCVLMSCAFIFFSGSIMLGEMHPVMIIFLSGFCFLYFLISLSIFASPFTVQMLNIVASAFFSSAVSSCPSIISPSAMFALHPYDFTCTFICCW